MLIKLVSNVNFISIDLTISYDPRKVVSLNFGFPFNDRTNKFPCFFQVFFVQLKIFVIIFIFGFGFHFVK